MRRAATRDRSTAGALAALGVLLLSLFFLLADPGTARAASAGCAADAATGCINGTIRTADQQPAVGVVLDVDGPGGASSATTDAEGRWTVAVTAAGEYTVTLDVATLPAGETLRDPAGNPRTVTVALGSSTGALFPLGAPPAGGSGGSDDAGADPEPGSTAPADGEVGAPTGSSDSGSFSWGRLAQQASSGLVFGVLLALASVGLSLIYGTTGLSNFAHGEQVTLGAIVAYVAVQSFGLPLLVAGVIAVLVGAASGWVQDAGIWHPLRKRRVGTTQQMIVTIGLSMALQYTYQFFFGGGALRIVTTTPTMVTLGPVRISATSLWSLLIAAVVLAGVAYFLLGTRVGRATRAVSDNPALAAASGITVDRIVRLVWILGAALAALGGVLMGLYLNATSWNMGGALLLLMFAAVTLGGLGQAFGALAGSIVIGLVVEMSNLVIPSDMRYAGALLILILVLLLRPQGILGRAERIG
ncbi:branched-chain amino acid ABC transporter permease [Cellulomonas sp. ACRRI]|uniref:branched-chain amino acid ABC transporter permease n=1 Tax=Cellulomonas sp. ACRRI TaxID=2918188 RepID=UPI001EF26C0D|nr:branched-chain amino acid ABC transporter permease [Cellulomonas sp. ACRRI]MCG7286557.1 branched-chain amino acid ABC transporter permease [Cellulomonas sp. ACRRI]